MPIFEYKCENCLIVYECLEIHNPNPDLQKPCPKCKRMNGKIMSAPAFILKDEGVGWANKGYNRQYSIADGPERKTGDRHGRSGKTVVPVRGGMSIEPNKDDSKKKKPMLKVQK